MLATRAILLMLVTATLAGCEPTAPTLSLTFAWESPPPAQALWATFVVRADASAGNRGAIVASQAGVPLDSDFSVRGDGLDVPFGSDLSVAVELRTSSLAEQRVVYYGRSEAFDFDADSGGVLDVAINLRAPQTETGNTLVVTLDDGSPVSALPTSEVDTAKVRLSSERAVWFELANNPTFAQSVRFRFDGVDADDNKVADCSTDVTTTCRLGWTLLAEESAAESDIRVVYARFEDEAGYLSPTLRREVVVDGTPPSCVNNVFVPAAINGQAYVTDENQPEARFFFGEDLTEPLELRLNGESYAASDYLKPVLGGVSARFACSDSDDIPEGAILIDCTCPADGMGCRRDYEVELFIADRAGNATTCILNGVLVGDNVLPDAEVQRLLDVATHTRAPWGTADVALPEFGLSFEEEPQGLDQVDTLSVWAALDTDCTDVALIDVVPWHDIWKDAPFVTRFESSSEFICIALTDRAGNSSAERNLDGVTWDRPPKLVSRGRIQFTTRDTESPSPLKVEQQHGLHGMLSSRDASQISVGALDAPGDGAVATTYGAPRWKRLSDALPGGQHIGVRGALAFDAARGQLWHGQRCLEPGSAHDCRQLDPTPGYFNGHVWTPAAVDVQADAAPPTAFGHVAVYDPRRAGVVVFGGAIDFVDGAAPRQDTWLWTGSSWRLLDSGEDTPEFGDGLQEAQLVYDTRRGQPLLVGRVVGGPEHLSVFALGSDGKWRLDPWTGLGPSVREGASAAFDSTAGEVVYMGGDSGSCGGELDSSGGYTTMRLPPCDRVWRFDRQLSTWTVQEEGLRPPARLRRGLAFDRSRERLVAIGGCNIANDFEPPGVCHNDLWEEANGVWQQVSTPAESRPHTADFGTAVYDPIAESIVYSAALPPCGWGDWCPLVDPEPFELRPGLWRWDGTGWEALQTEESEPPPSGLGVGVGAWEDGLIAFGGRPHDQRLCEVAELRTRTYVWGDRGWRKAPEDTFGPAAQTDPTLVYQPGPGDETGRLFLADGEVASCYNEPSLLDESVFECECTTFYTLPDIWEFDGNTWDVVSNVSPGRGGMAAAFDDSGNLYFVGGYDNSNVCSPSNQTGLEIPLTGDDLCGYASHSAIRVDDWSIAHDDVAGSMALRFNAAMAYDAFRRQFVLYGGTWVDDAGLPSTDTLVASIGSQDPAEQLVFERFEPTSNTLQPDTRQLPSLIYADSLRSVLLFGGTVDNSSACDGEWTGGTCRGQWRWQGDGWTQVVDTDAPFGDGGGDAPIGRGTEGAVWDRANQRALVLQSTVKEDADGVARSEVHSWQVPADERPAHLLRLPRHAIGSDTLSIDAIRLRAETGGRGGEDTEEGARLLRWRLWSWEPLAWESSGPAGSVNTGNSSALVMSESASIAPGDDPFNTLETLYLAIVPRQPNGAGAEPAVVSTGYVEVVVDYTVGQD